MANFEDIGKDITKEIMSWLPVNERGNFTRTCRAFKQVSQMVIKKQMGLTILVRQPDEELPGWFPAPHWTTGMIVKEDWIRLRMKVHPSTFVPYYIPGITDQWVDIYEGFGIEWTWNPTPRK